MAPGGCEVILRSLALSARRAATVMSSTPDWAINSVSEAHSPLAMISDESSCSMFAHMSYTTLRRLLTTCSIVSATRLTDRRASTTSTAPCPTRSSTPRERYACRGRGEVCR